MPICHFALWNFILFSITLLSVHFIRIHSWPLIFIISSEVILDFITSPKQKQMPNYNLFFFSLGFFKLMIKWTYLTLKPGTMFVSLHLFVQCLLPSQPLTTTIHLPAFSISVKVSSSFHLAKATNIKVFSDISFFLNHEFSSLSNHVDLIPIYFRTLSSLFLLPFL